MTARLVSVDPVIVVDDLQTDQRAAQPPQSRADFLDRLGAAASEKPGAAALIGLGAVWFLAKASGVSLPSFKISRDRGARHPDTRLDDRWMQRTSSGAASRSESDDAGVGAVLSGTATAVDGSVGRAASAVGDAAASASAQAAETASAGYDTVRSTGKAAVRTASGAASAAYDAAAGAGASAYDAASRAGSSAYEASRDASHSMEEAIEGFFHRQPLVVGVLAVAVGAGVAALLPGSSVEDRYLGEASDEAKSKAKSFAEGKAEAMRDAAKDALDGVVANAKDHGLSRSGAADLVRKAGDKLGKVASAASDSVKAELK